METNPFINRLRLIVLEHYTNEKFGVRELAEQFGMSRSQLHRKLKSATGQSISQFIREIRLEESIKMLQNEDLSASEVAYKVGFNSPSYFNRCFHEYFGYTPGEVQHRMELAKANNENIDFPGRRKTTPHIIKHNLFIWLPVAIILITVFYMVYNLSGKESNSIPVIPENTKTIAVLPLKNWSGDVDLEHVSDGITDAIISKLSGIEDMDRVIPFTSVERYKDSHLSVQEIAKELDVAYVLEGNFKLAGEHLQCKVNLIEVENNTIIWTEEYNRIWESENIFTMQANVAKSIAENLQLDLGNEELSSIQYIPTENTEAYNLYLRGRYQYEKSSAEGFKNAISLFKKAIEHDSLFFLPYLGITESYVLMGFVWGGGEKDVLINNAEKYYELASKYYNPNYREHWESLREVKMNIDFNFKWDFGQVKQELMKNGGDGCYGFDMARKFGQYDLAIKIGENSEWFNDGDGLFFLGKAQVLMLMGENEKAIKLLEELDPLNKQHYFYLMESAKIYYYLNERDKMKQQMERFFKVYNDNPSQILWIAAVNAEMEGDIQLVNHYLDFLKKQVEEQESGSPAWFLAMYYCHVEDYDKALEWLETSYDLKEVEMTWLKEEPLLRPLRDNPTYIDLYEKVGFSKVFPIASSTQ